MLSKSHWRVSLLMIALVFFILSCGISKQANSPFEKDDIGMYQAQKKRIPKGAIRLEVELTSDIKEDNDRYTYQATVLKVVQTGATFNGKRPKKGDKIKLTTKVDPRLNKGDKIKLDGMTYPEDSNDVLTVVML